VNTARLIADKGRNAFLLERLTEALRRGGGTHTLVDVVAMLHSGDAQFWQHEAGAAVTQIVEHPRMRELVVWLTAGQLEDCLRLQGRIERHAREHGCARIIGRGRTGWDRIAASRMGFQHAGIHIEKWLVEQPT
jgi:hypothetical protein